MPGGGGVEDEDHLLWRCPATAPERAKSWREPPAGLDEWPACLRRCGLVPRHPDLALLEAGKAPLRLDQHRELTFRRWAAGDVRPPELVADGRVVVFTDGSRKGFMHAPPVQRR